MYREIVFCIHPRRNHVGPAPMPQMISKSTPFIQPIFEEFNKVSTCETPVNDFPIGSQTIESSSSSSSVSSAMMNSSLSDISPSSSTSSDFTPPFSANIELQFFTPVKKRKFSDENREEIQKTKIFKSNSSPCNNTLSNDFNLCHIKATAANTSPNSILSFLQFGSL